ncbi:MAG: beta-galactosidase trimerization domain-containing protein, partial [Armatimonadetes bacterium]|nr:beta-galactosidase trimerization domain-containing protein [Armatimonadota bacterium]
TLHERAHYLSTEAHPPAYLHADLTTRYCEGLGKPFTLFMPESQGSWGDWTTTTPETIKGLSAIALAHGGSLNINHVPYPCGDRGGTVPQVVWDTITATFDFVAEREELCRSSRPVPVVACLHSADNVRLLRAVSRIEDRQHLGGAIHHAETAVTQLLVETHTPWEVRPETISPDDLARYELVVLPCLPHVTDELADRLREYVAGGGKLLASYRTSLTGARGEALDNFALADLFGVDLVEESPYSIAYLDALDDVFRPQVPDMPLLLKDVASDRMNPKNHALYCRLRDGALALGRIMDPIIESDFETGHWVYHDHSPPGHLTEYPAVVHNRFGDGEVIYLPPSFLGAYGSKACPFLKEVFRTLVEDVLGVSGKVRISAPVSIKTSLQEDSEGWLLHLIHIQKQTDAMYLDSFTRADPVTVRLRPGWRISQVEDCLSGADFPLRQVDGWEEFTVPGVHDHTMVRVRR